MNRMTTTLVFATATHNYFDFFLFWSLSSSLYSL